LRISLYYGKRLPVLILFFKKKVSNRRKKPPLYWQRETEHVIFLLEIGYANKDLIFTAQALNSAVPEIGSYSFSVRTFVGTSLKWKLINTRPGAT